MAFLKEARRATPPAKTLASPVAPYWKVDSATILKSYVQISIFGLNICVFYVDESDTAPISNLMCAPDCLPIKNLETPLNLGQFAIPSALMQLIQDRPPVTVFTPHRINGADK